MQTVIYMSVYKDEPYKDKFSIKNQHDLLLDYIRVYDWELRDIYIDEDISTNQHDKPALNRLINDIKAGTVKNVLVYSISRLARNTKETKALIDLFSDYRCRVTYRLEDIDTLTPDGREQLNMILEVMDKKRPIPKHRTNNKDIG